MPLFEKPSTSTFRMTPPEPQVKPMPSRLLGLQEAVAGERGRVSHDDVLHLAVRAGVQLDAAVRLRAWPLRDRDLQIADPEPPDRADDGPVRLDDPGDRMAPGYCSGLQGIATRVAVRDRPGGLGRQLRSLQGERVMVRPQRGCAARNAPAAKATVRLLALSDAAHSMAVAIARAVVDVRAAVDGCVGGEGPFRRPRQVGQDVDHAVGSTEPGRQRLPPASIQVLVQRRRPRANAAFGAEGPRAERRLRGVTGASDAGRLVCQEGRLGVGQIEAIETPGGHSALLREEGDVPSPPRSGRCCPGAASLRLERRRARAGLRSRSSQTADPITHIPPLGRGSIRRCQSPSGARSERRSRAEHRCAKERLTSSGVAATRAH